MCLKNNGGTFTLGKDVLYVPKEHECIIKLAYFHLGVDKFALLHDTIPNKNHSQKHFDTCY